MSRLRVAGVGFLNALPLTHGLADDPSIELFLGLPSEVARRLNEGECDLALVPVAAAATLGDVDFLDLGIVARGPVRSVVVAANEPIERLEHLALDASSRTSVVLARLELAARGVRAGERGRVVARPPSEVVTSIGGSVGGVIIGDPALDIEGRFPHVLDLGRAWNERTGLPFVFAAWAARRGSYTEALVDRLRRAAAEGIAAREEIARRYASQRGLPPAGFVSYLRDSISHTIDERAEQGLSRFLTDAAEAKLLPPPDVRVIRTARPEPKPRASLDALLVRVADGGRLTATEGLRLYEEASLFDLGLAADAVRKRKNKPDVVTYIVDRNVNYTNVCTTSCKFCAFYRPVGHDDGYVLSREVLGQKLQEVVDAGGVQILLQGGLNPNLRIEWYEDLFRWIKATYGLGLHALSPEEILHISILEGLDVPAVLRRLNTAGLDSVPGGGAEILVDRVRRNIAKAKCTSEEWLSVMRAAHHMGLRSSGTMMYGTTDTAQDRIAHLVKLRDLQDETGGFTAFFCWDFQYERGTRIASGDHGTVLYLRTQAIARLMLDNVDHVGASWVTQGPHVGQVALRFGADDWGSVMFEENVVSSAGTTFRMDAARIEDLVHRAGYKAVRRNVKYQHLGEPA
ncbi:MAG: dehypoxanthine futalosine cyclase [Sandaracinaceae bacterium]|nr:dehypoxanthine futalosine cyclase [Sandaracinaceae bacterium]